MTSRQLLSYLLTFSIIGASFKTDSSAFAQRKVFLSTMILSKTTIDELIKKKFSYLVLSIDYDNRRGRPDLIQLIAQARYPENRELQPITLDPAPGENRFPADMKYGIYKLTKPELDIIINNIPENTTYDNLYFRPVPYTKRGIIYHNIVSYEITPILPGSNKSVPLILFTIDPCPPEICFE